MAEIIDMENTEMVVGFEAINEQIKIDSPFAEPDEGCTTEAEESLAKYKLAPEIYENYVVKIINNHRNDLSNAKIVTMFRRGKWYKKNMETWGSAKKVSPEMRVLTGPADFLIIVNAEIWKGLSEAERLALVDHELLHCVREDDDKNGNPRYGLRNHDFEGFYAEVRRHGIWSPGLKRAKKAYDESKQGTIFDPLTQQNQEIIEEKIDG